MNDSKGSKASELKNTAASFFLPLDFVHVFHHLVKRHILQYSINCNTIHGVCSGGSRGM